MERLKYAGWPNCYRLANTSIELVITADVGPRVIRMALPGGPNEFREYPDMIGKTGGDEWRIYGGHRLWHSPEAKPRSYAPDNGPVRVEPTADGCVVTQPVEASTGIQKEMEFRLSGAAHVIVTHRLTNTGPWPVRLAAWALSVMAQGGVAILPLPPAGNDLLPTAPVALWGYTNMADPRWTWGREFILLRQDPKATTPVKIGLATPAGWAAYARNGHLFVKRFDVSISAEYPDFGCTTETYTCADMLELETVGPLHTLAPGEQLEHIERWFLFDGVPAPATEADVLRDVLPAVQRTA